MLISVSGCRGENVHLFSEWLGKTIRQDDELSWERSHLDSKAALIFFSIYPHPLALCRLILGFFSATAKHCGIRWNVMIIRFWKKKCRVNQVLTQMISGKLQCRATSKVHYYLFCETGPTGIWLSFQTKVHSDIVYIRNTLYNKYNRINNTFMNSKLPPP